ncbi:MAG: GTPase Era [Desulfovibrionaceae bacterium]|nr:GTPase Era [Desulfovibrionaceae bacterium]
MASYRCGRVALMGPPNAGKSTLINALVGQKVAIVTAKPQTTRNRIVGILTRPDAQIIFMDTPGINASRGANRGQLGKIMHRSAWQSFENAECILLVLDGDLYVRKPEFMDRDLQPLLAPLREELRPVVVVFNKVDLFHDKSRMLPLLVRLAELLPKVEIFPASGLKKDGVEDMIRMIVSHLPEAEAEFPADQLSTAPVRFMAAEIIREKLFDRLYQEVPYTVAVEIENWEENAEQAIINAVIYVAKPSHKAMVIGHGGSGIRETGTEARKELKELLDKKVHLELWVKVRDDWANDQNFLHALGFGSEFEA